MISRYLEVIPVSLREIAHSRASILLVYVTDRELWLVPIWSPQIADFRFDCAVAGKKNLKNSAAKCANVAQRLLLRNSSCSLTFNARKSLKN